MVYCRFSNQLVHWLLSLDVCFQLHRQARQSQAEPETTAEESGCSLRRKLWQQMKGSMETHGTPQVPQRCVAGWWFGTFFIFPIYLEESSQLTFIFFRGVGIPPTRLRVGSTVVEILLEEMLGLGVAYPLAPSCLWWAHGFILPHSGVMRSELVSYLCFGSRDTKAAPMRLVFPLKTFRWIWFLSGAACWATYPEAWTCGRTFCVYFPRQYDGNRSKQVSYYTVDVFWMPLDRLLICFPMW